VRTGAWDEGLLEHVQGCITCQGVSSVAGWVSARVSDPPPETSDAGARWLWRVAANTRQVEDDRAVRVLALGRRFAFVLVSVSALLAAQALRGPLAQALAPLEGGLQSALTTLAELAAQRAGLLAALLLLATLHLWAPPVRH